MLTNEKQEFKKEFYRIINNVGNTKLSELQSTLKKLNDSLEHYDFFIRNWIQRGKRFFTKDVRKLLKNYVDDILDGYDSGKGYEPEDKRRVAETLAMIIQKYDNNNKTFLDKFLAVLGRT